MVNFLNRRFLTFLSLLGAGFVVILIWSGPANATQLKDIRVGEYDKFTRIVFELDEPTTNPDIEIQPSGRLLVTFTKASASLVRKIPVERSPHVKDIQIWQRREGLSALLISDYPNIRVESFRLSQPPRLAVDIFPIAKLARETANPSTPLVPVAEEITSKPEKIVQRDTTDAAEKKIPSQTNVQAPENPEQPSVSISEESLSPPSDRDGSATPIDQQQSDVQSEETPAPEEKIDTPVAVDGSSAPPMLAKTDPPPFPEQRTPESTNTSPTDIKNKPHSSKNRLQLYLVVTLVIITIVILLLLLLMLLTSRHRLSDDKTKSKPSQRLQHQEKKIAALNSRIKEQFKRYDEA